MLSKSMKIKNNELWIHDHRLTDVAKQHGTPLIVYDEEGIQEKIARFKEHFRSESIATQIVYASKAFLCRHMARLVDAEGLWIDAVSMGEAHVILSAGVPAKRIVFHGNNKSEAELRYAVEQKIGLIVVDNLKELSILSQIAKGQTNPIETLFRINPGIEAHTHEYIQTSLLSSKFGESIYDQEAMARMTKLYRNTPRLRLKGFHIHIGSQIKSEAPYLLAAQVMTNFVGNYNTSTGMGVDTINFGGGFGINYVGDEEEFDLSGTLEEMVRIVERKNKEDGLGVQTLMIEPGRNIVGQNGFTLYTASQIKKTYGGKNYCFIDGGMTDNIRPALYQAKYAVKAVSNMTSDETILVDVVGKCCESGDIIAKDVLLPSTIDDDVIVVFCTGAYGYSMSSNYNGLTRPKVLFIGKDSINVAIERETIEEIAK